MALVALETISGKQIVIAACLGNLGCEKVFCVTLDQMISAYVQTRLHLATHQPTRAHLRWWEPYSLLQPKGWHKIIKHTVFKVSVSVSIDKYCIEIIHAHIF